MWWFLFTIPFRFCNRYLYPEADLLKLKRFLAIFKTPSKLQNKACARKNHYGDRKVDRIFSWNKKKRQKEYPLSPFWYERGFISWNFFLGQCLEATLSVWNFHSFHTARRGLLYTCLFTYNYGCIHIINLLFW